MLRLSFAEGELARFAAALDSAGVFAPDVLSSVSGSLAKLAQNNARNCVGGGFGKQTVADSVKATTDGSGQMGIYSDSYIAEHVHLGGVIRPKNAKMLAIPIDDSARGVSPRQEWDQRGLFILRRKTDGADRAYIAETRGKRQVVRLLYVLKRSVTQKPRPWWPTDDDVRRLAEKDLQFFVSEAEDTFSARMG